MVKDDLYEYVEQQIRKMRCSMCYVRRDAENGVGEPCWKVGEYVNTGKGCPLDEVKNETE